MSVQTTKAEIARAKLVTGLILLAVMAGSCAPKMIANAAPQPPAVSATTTS